MTTMISEVYDAFRSVGVPEEKARKAAEALSSDAVATKGDMLKLDKEMAAMRTDIVVLKWMVGLVIALAVANFGKQFF